jgi:DNA recombination protein RmuC
MHEALAGRQAELARSVNERLDAVSQSLGQSIQTTTQNTVENLQKLNERLAVIDTAQKTIADLSQKTIPDLASQVTSLQNVLSNKQSRGAFGQAQLEALIADVLPKGAYAFQHTLSNNTRPDCAVFLPDAGPLIIDAKFPLEAVNSLRGAVTDDERKQATQRVRQDIAKHVTDIAGKYLIPGETQDIALMFIPSESVYAELHERFDDVVQRAQRARVMIVSPTLMVMAIQVIKQIRKDAQMREAADQIRGEVGHMMKDVRLLGERVRKLQQHFGQTGKDIEDILTSAGRIEKRAGRIEALDFDDDTPRADSSKAEVLPSPIARRLSAAE